MLTDIRNMPDRLQIFRAYLVPRIIGVVEDDVGEVILEFSRQGAQAAAVRTVTLGSKRRELPAKALHRPRPRVNR